MNGLSNGVRCGPCEKGFRKKISCNDKMRGCCGMDLADVIRAGSFLLSMRSRILRMRWMSVFVVCFVARMRIWLR